MSRVWTTLNSSPGSRSGGSSRDRRPEARLIHQRAQVAKGFAPVADGVFFLRRELGGGLVFLGDEEKRVVSEPVLAPGGVDDSPFDGVAGGEDDSALRVGQGEDADESCGALVVEGLG